LQEDLQEEVTILIDEEGRMFLFTNTVFKQRIKDKGDQTPQAAGLEYSTVQVQCSTVLFTVHFK